MSSMKNYLDHLKEKKSQFCLLAQRPVTSLPSLRHSLWMVAQLLSLQALLENVRCSVWLVPLISQVQSGYWKLSVCPRVGAHLALPVTGATGGTAREASLRRSSSGHVSSIIANMFQMPPTASLFIFFAFTLSSHVVIFYKSFSKAPDFLDCLTFAITNKGITALARLVPTATPALCTFWLLAHCLYEPIEQFSGFLTSKTVGRKKKHTWIKLKDFKTWKSLNYIAEREKCKFFWIN